MNETNPTGDFADPLEWLRQIGAPEGGLREWEQAHRAALAERERLREALRGLISCHGMAVNPGTQHAKCGFLAAAHAALSGSPQEASDG